MDPRAPAERDAAHFFPAPSGPNAATLTRPPRDGVPSTLAASPDRWALLIPCGASGNHVHIDATVQGRVGPPKFSMLGDSRQLGGGGFATQVTLPPPPTPPHCFAGLAPLVTVDVRLSSHRSSRARRRSPLWAFGGAAGRGFVGRCGPSSRPVDTPVSPALSGGGRLPPRAIGPGGGPSSTGLKRAF